MFVIPFKGRHVCMKSVFSSLFGLLLAVCLTLYGPLGMVTAGTDGGVFSIELCADGVAKTVLVDADGQPVAHTRNCPDCLMCCNAVGARPNAPLCATHSVALLELQTDGPLFHNPVFKKRNILPVPRGPPSLHVYMPRSPDLTGFDQADSGHKTRSAGRPFLQDASA